MTGAPIYVSISVTILYLIPSPLVPMVLPLTAITHWKMTTGIGSTALLLKELPVSVVMMPSPVSYNRLQLMHLFTEWQPVHLSHSHGKEQPDRLVHFATEQSICDVTVVNPIARTYTRRYATDYGGLLWDAEDMKRKKYAHLTHDSNSTVMGLAFDVFGGMGPGATNLLLRLGTLAQESYLFVSPAQYIALLFDRVAITLGRRVGALIKRGALGLSRATGRMTVRRDR